MRNKSFYLLICLWCFAAVHCRGMPPAFQAVRKNDGPGLNRALQDPGAARQIHKGRLALHHAVTLGRIEMVLHLLKAGAPVNAPLRNPENGIILGTPLILAISRGGRPLMELLFESGAKIDVPGWNGMTPLMEAARMGRPKLVQMLLRKGADINRTDEDNRTALTWAAITGRGDTVLLLLRQGASRDIPDIFNKTAVDYARSANHRSVLRALKQ